MNIGAISLGRLQHAVEEIANDLVTVGRHANGLTRRHERADHGGSGMGFSRARRPLNWKYAPGKRWGDPQRRIEALFHLLSGSAARQAVAAFA